MNNKTEALRSALATNQLVLVEFYNSSESRNAWLEKVIEAYNKETGRHINVVIVNMDENEELVNAYRVAMAPAFILLLRKKELWRKLGKLTVDELQEVLSQF